MRGEGTVRGGSGLPPGRGRGSSVSSIICYLIGLSHVDPVAQPTLLPTLSQRGSASRTGHRPRFRARHSRATDPAGLRALRPRPRRAGVLVRDVSPAQRGARPGQGARAAGAGHRQAGPALGRWYGQLGPARAGDAARVSGPGGRADVGAPDGAGRADRRVSHATSASTSAA